MAAKILKFLEEAGKLKAVPREGWKMRGIKDCESVAEHTFRVAFIAMLLSEIEKCSMQKALKMSLLHDLPESRVGDLTRRSSNYRQKREIEKKAMSKILKNLPGKLRKEYMQLWGEYREGRTREAKLVKYADKLEMLLQAKEYAKQGYDTSDFWKEEYEFEGTALEIYDLLKPS
ncbi:MAG: HD domain-containing protein [Euryarchaeota archaeon]|nr:HD domain-containing protein [Euryarchaeota archaeon]